MRTDARRNRQSIVNAAIEVVLEVGGEPSRDTVAERAGVGIATLYRHFPDQQQLLHAIAVEVLDRAISEGRAALEKETSGGQALRRYLHAAIDTGLGAINIVHPLLDDHDWPEQRDAARDVLDKLAVAAIDDGAAGQELTASDIALAAIRFCRPLAIGLTADHERAISHQQLDRYLDGLAAQRRQPDTPTGRFATCWNLRPGTSPAHGGDGRRELGRDCLVSRLGRSAARAENRWPDDPAAPRADADDQNAAERIGIKGSIGCRHALSGSTVPNPSGDVEVLDENAATRTL